MKPAVTLLSALALMLGPIPSFPSEAVPSGHAAGTPSAREAVQATPSSGPLITNPEEHLRPFVEFLRREGAEPKTFLLQALADRQVVIMGEVHNRPRYWAFNSSLVRDKAFAERVGVIYMKLPSNDQGLVEQFLAAPTETRNWWCRCCETCKQPDGRTRRNSSFSKRFGRLTKECQRNADCALCLRICRTPGRRSKRPPI